MRLSDAAIDFLLVSTGFSVALALYNAFFEGGLTGFEMALGTGVSVVAFWGAVELRRRSLESAAVWIAFIERFCLGTGVNLLLHAVLTYTFYIRRTPFLIAAGGGFAALFLTLRARFANRHRLSQKRVLLIGFDSLSERICSLMRGTQIAVVTSQPGLVPAGIPCLGDFNDLERVLAEYKPTTIVVGTKDWAKRILPSLLLTCLLNGTIIEESQTVYEQFLSRVCCERLRPMDLMLSSALRGDSRTMAIQAVYTNLIGLALLILLSPVLLIAALAVKCGSGPGPVFESFECAGFQYIPFRLLRFRTTRLDGRWCWPGRLILRLRLTNVPQLVNVVRGDMALVGPQPVRTEFARYMTDLMPFYSHRFTVRPGILGWARLHAPRAGQVADECRRIEYDLFYVKEGSLWMDAQIMLESPFFFRVPRAAGQPG